MTLRSIYSIAFFLAFAFFAALGLAHLASFTGFWSLSCGTSTGFSSAHSVVLDSMI